MRQSQSLLLTAPGLWPVSPSTPSTFGGRVIPVCSSFWDPFIIPGIPNERGWPWALLPLGVVSALTFVITIIFICLWAMFHPWGSWRLHRNSRDGTRRQYVKKWYGWVTKDTAERCERRWQRWKDWFSQRFVLRTTTVDWRWVFWDPDGSGQREYQQRRDNTFLRHCPKWMRSERRTVEQHAAQRASDESRAERGMLGYLNTSAATSQAFDHSLSGTLWNMLCAPFKPSAPATTEETEASERRTSTAVDPHDRGNSTIRRRNSVQGSRSIWQSGSEEVNRAIRQQLPLPSIGSPSGERLLPDHPPQEPIFPFSPSDGIRESEPNESTPVVSVRPEVRIRPRVIRPYARNPHPDLAEQFDAAAYEDAHASDSAPSTNSSASSNVQTENEPRRASQNIVASRAQNPQSSSGVEEFYTPASHRSTRIPSFTHETRSSTTEPSTCISPDYVYNLAEANLETRAASQASSLGLGRFPVPPTGITNRDSARSRSLSSPVDERAIRRRPSTSNPRLRSQSGTFQRLAPHCYIHNARQRSPSMLSRLAYQMPSSSSSSGDSPPADQGTSRALPCPELDQVDGASTLVRRPSSGSDEMSPSPPRVPTLAVRTAGNSTRENQADSTGWINAPRATLQGVQWKGFSDSG